MLAGKRNGDNFFSFEEKFETFLHSVTKVSVPCDRRRRICLCRYLCQKLFAHIVLASATAWKTEEEVGPSFATTWPSKLRRAATVRLSFVRRINKPPRLPFCPSLSNRDAFGSCFDS